jgi:hypothetical protein
MKLNGLAMLAVLLTSTIPVCRGQETALSDAAVSGKIGLEVGARAPGFALVDQFGHEQSNETLKGTKGTVLLFFRSADW